MEREGASISRLAAALNAATERMLPRRLRMAARISLSGFSCCCIGTSGEDTVGVTAAATTPSMSRLNEGSGGEPQFGLGERRSRNANGQDRKSKSLNSSH